MPPQPESPVRPLRVVIADDEPAARDKLQRLLSARPDVEVAGVAATGGEAARAITTLEPDVVFLDIRMPELDGLEVIERTRTAPRFHTIFVSAFDEYAVQAFDVRAIDYLLKPFDADRLAAALRRVREQVELEHRAGERAAGAPGPSQVLAQVGAPRGEAELEATGGRYLERICIRDAGRTQVVRVAQVEWFEAYGNYVRLHTPAEHSLVRDTLRRLESQLDPGLFCRIHRSALVNIDRVRQLRPATSGDSIVTLESGVRLRLSRKYRAELMSRMRR